MKHYKHCKLLPKLQFPLVIYYQRNPTLIIWLCSRSLVSEHFMQCLKSKKMALSLVGKARHLVGTGTQCTYNYFTHGVVQDSKAIGRYTLICYTFRITHTFKYQVVHTHVSFKRIFKKKKKLDVWISSNLMSRVVQYHTGLTLVEQYTNLGLQH